jgi:hypothetical protein
VRAPKPRTEPCRYCGATDRRRLYNPVGYDLRSGPEIALGLWYGCCARDVKDQIVHETDWCLKSEIRTGRGFDATG